MHVLNVTEGDGLHNHSCYIAYKRKEKKSDLFCFAFYKYCALPNMFKKNPKLKTYQTKIQRPCS